MITVTITWDVFPNENPVNYGIRAGDYWVFEEKQWAKMEGPGQRGLASGIYVPTDPGLSPNDDLDYFDIKSIAFSLGKSGFFVAVICPDSVGMIFQRSDTIGENLYANRGSIPETYTLSEPDIQRARNELKAKFLIES